MNGRIKELIDHHERINNLYIIGPVQRAEVEDFVEAIVNDIAEYFGREGEGRFEVDGNWIAKTIRQHFGIE